MQMVDSAKVSYHGLEWGARVVGPLGGADLPTDPLDSRYGVEVAVAA